MYSDRHLCNLLEVDLPSWFIPHKHDREAPQDSALTLPASATLQQANWWLVHSNRFGMHEQYNKLKFHQINKSAQQIILVIIVSKTSQVHSEQALGCSRGQNSCQARKFLSAGANEACNRGFHRIIIMQNLFLLVRTTTTGPANH